MPPRRVKKPKLEYPNTSLPVTRARFKLMGTDNKLKQALQTFKPVLSRRNEHEKDDIPRSQEIQADQNFIATATSVLNVQLPSDTLDEEIVNVYPIADSRSHNSTETLQVNYQPIMPKSDISDLTRIVHQESTFHTHSPVEVSSPNYQPLISNISESVMNLYQERDLQSGNSFEILPMNQLPLIPKISETAINTENNSQSSNSDEISSENPLPLMPKISESVMNVCDVGNSISSSSVEISPVDCLSLIPKNSESENDVHQDGNFQPANSVAISPVKCLPLLGNNSKLLMNVSQEENFQSSSSATEILPVIYLPSISNISESKMITCQKQSSRSTFSAETLPINHLSLMAESEINVYQEENSQSSSSVEISPVDYLSFRPKIAESEISVNQQTNLQTSEEVKISNYCLPLQPKTYKSVMDGAYQLKMSQSRNSNEVSLLNYGPLQPRICKSLVNGNQQEISCSNSIEISPSNNLPPRPRISDWIRNVQHEANSQLETSVVTSRTNYVSPKEMITESVTDPYQAFNSQYPISVRIPPANNQPSIPKYSEPPTNEFQQANSFIVNPAAPLEMSPHCYVPSQSKNSETEMNKHLNENSLHHNLVENSQANCVPLQPKSSATISAPPELQTPCSASVKILRGIHSLAVQDSDVNISAKSLLTNTSSEPLPMKPCSERPPCFNIENSHSKVLSMDTEKKTITSKLIRRQRQRVKLEVTWRFPLPERIGRWMLTKQQREDILKRQSIPTRKI